MQWLRHGMGLRYWASKFPTQTNGVRLRQCGTKTYGVQLTYSAWLKQNVQLWHMVFNWDIWCAIEMYCVQLSNKMCVTESHMCVLDTVNNKLCIACDSVWQTLQLRHAVWLCNWDMVCHRDTVCHRDAWCATEMYIDHLRDSDCLAWQPTERHSDQLCGTVND